MDMVWVFSIIHKQIRQTDLSLFFSLKNDLREFVKKTNFLVSDRFTYSHHLSPWLFFDIVRRKLMLVTIMT